MLTNSSGRLLLPIETSLGLVGSLIKSTQSMHVLAGLFRNILHFLNSDHFAYRTHFYPGNGAAGVRVCVCVGVGVCMGAGRMSVGCVAAGRRDPTECGPAPAEHRAPS